MIGRGVVADVDKSCNQVQLTKNGSQRVFFKIMPRYKHMAEGELVAYNDHLILFNVKTELYLHTSSDLLDLEKDVLIER